MKQINKLIKELTNILTHEWKNEQKIKDWMNECKTNEQMDELSNNWMNNLTNECTNNIN